MFGYHSLHLPLCALRVLRGSSPSPRGFTLIEAIAATAILGVGVTGIVVAGSAAMVAQREGAKRNTAVMLASGKLSDVDHIGPYQAMLEFPEQGNFEPEYPEYEWQLLIEPELVGQLYTITVEVSWPARNGRASFSMATMLNDSETGEGGTAEGAESAER